MFSYKTVQGAAHEFIQTRINYNQDYISNVLYFEYETIFSPLLSRTINKFHTHKVTLMRITEFPFLEHQLVQSYHYLRLAKHM